MSDQVRLTNAALDEVGNDVVIRGVIDPASLAMLKVAPYQREILLISTIRELAAAIRKGGVPDICLGMRGSRFEEPKGEFILQDDVYIIDGLQRRTAALEIMRSGGLPHLGAVVYVNTDEAWERRMFRALNILRTRLSPNVLLRNEAYDNEFVAMLYDLCKDPAFALYGRVSWDQRIKRGELMTAVGLLKITGRLHSRFKSGLIIQHHEVLAAKMQAVMQRISRKAVRENIRRYWQTIDDAFGVKNVTFKEGASHLRQAFNVVLAHVFANHQNFWKDAEFGISGDLVRKLSLFPITDPHVASLCAANLGGPATGILYKLVVDHINSGKRTRRLTAFGAAASQPELEMYGIEGEEEDEEELLEQSTAVRILPDIKSIGSEVRA